MLTGILSLDAHYFRLDIISIRIDLQRPYKVKFVCSNVAYLRIVSVS